MSRKNKPNPTEPVSTTGTAPLPLKEDLKQRTLDTYDLMEMFKVTRGTINNWCRKGLLKFMKMGSKRFFDAHEIKAKWEEHKQNEVPGEERKKK